MTTMKKSIAFGDSVLEGVILDDRRCGKEGVRYMFLKDNFTSQLGRRIGMQIENCGKFGCTITTGESVMERHIDEISRSKYTFFEFGGNDSDFIWEDISKDPDIIHHPRTDLRTFSLTYKRIIDRVRQAGSRPVMLSLTPLYPDRYFEHITKTMDQAGRANILRWLGGSIESITNWHEMYNLQVFKLGMAMNVPVVDITSAFLSKKDFRDYMCLDGIHPNENGHRLIADAVCDHFIFKK